MQASDMHSDWYEAQLVAATKTPGDLSVTALVALYGTKALVAKAAGVSSKSIERYVRYEAGERGKDVRNPDAPPTTAAARKARAGLQRAKDNGRVAADIRRKGLTVKAFAGDMVVSEEKRTIDPNEPRKPSGSDQHIPGDDLEGYLDALARGEWQRAAEEWDAAFFGGTGPDKHTYNGAYVVPGASLPDITRLDMEIG